MNPIEKAPTPTPAADLPLHALRRRRRVKNCLDQIVRLAISMNDQIKQRSEVVPETVLDHLTTASISLEAGLRRLSRPSRGTASE